MIEEITKDFAEFVIDQTSLIIAKNIASSACVLAVNAEYMGRPLEQLIKESLYFHIPIGSLACSLIDKMISSEDCQEIFNSAMDIRTINKLLTEYKAIISLHMKSQENNSVNYS